MKRPLQFALWGGAFTYAKLRSVLDRPLLRRFPTLAKPLPWADLATLPSPVEPLGVGEALWVKRDDLSSPIYGGNKVRSLEVLLGQALAQGATHTISTGAFGSNQALANALHARRLGLKTGAILFPQPPTPTAHANLRALLDSADELLALPHWSFLPWGMWWGPRRWRRAGHRPFVMVPGGATPAGALGYASAAFELLEQVDAGLLPLPRRIFIATGSTCTAAGLLLGLAIGSRDLGRRLPELVAVRVTPWPVTAASRIASLAAKAGLLLESMGGQSVPYGQLRAGLRVEGGQLGRGYGVPTAAGRAAIAQAAEVHPVQLDTTYSAKAAAATFAPRGEGPSLFWATKSAAPLPCAPAERIEAAPARMRRWLALNAE